MSYEDQVRGQIRGRLSIERLDLAVLASGRYQSGTMTAVLHGDTLIQLEEGDTSDILYGVVVDIGTTTVVCALVDMRTGEERADASMINAQKHFGLDVLTRISYEMEHPEDGISQLQKAIVDSINDMISEICAQAGVQREHIYEITVGANCTTCS